MNDDENQDQSPSNSQNDYAPSLVESTSSNSDRENRNDASTVMEQPAYFIRKKLVKGPDGYDIKLSKYNGRPYLDESHIIVIPDDKNSDGMNQLELTRGQFAFVIEVNGRNVQHVREPDIIDRGIMANDEQIELLLHYPEEVKENRLRIRAKFELFRDFNCELGIFVKKVFDPQNCPFKLFDEIVSIGHGETTREVRKKSIKDIERDAAGKTVTFDIKRKKDRGNTQQPFPTAITRDHSGDQSFSVTRVPSTASRSGSNGRDDTSGISPEPPTSVSKEHATCILPYDTSNSFIKELIVTDGTVGLTLTGGNKIGIYVEKIANWTSAHKCNIQVGWRILSICDVFLDDCTLGYAIDLMTKFQTTEKIIKILFERKTTQEYEDALKKNPYDFFTVRALTKYANMTDGLSFKKDDKINVISTFCPGNDGYRWKGYLCQINMSEDNAKYIPTISRPPGSKKWNNPKEGKFYEVLTEGVKVSLQLNPPATLTRQTSDVSV